MSTRLRCSAGFTPSQPSAPWKQAGDRRAIQKGDSAVLNVDPASRLPLPQVLAHTLARGTQHLSQHVLRGGNEIGRAGVASLFASWMTLHAKQGQRQSLLWPHQQTVTVKQVMYPGISGCGAQHLCGEVRSVRQCVVKILDTQLPTGHGSFHYRRGKGWAALQHFQLAECMPSIHEAQYELTAICIDPVNSCSGVNVEGNDDEHPDGRRHQALDGQA